MTAAAQPAPAARMRTRHALALALALVALATRWPLRSNVLDEYDGANYGLAVLRFSLEESRPHPPGYVFFVWAARAATRLTGDPVTGLSSLSAFSGAVSIALLFELLAPALGLFAAGCACVAAMFTGQVWLQQVRALQDSFALAWMLAAALGLLWAWRRATLAAWCASTAFLGLCAGAKQVLPLLLCGLLAWAARVAWSRGGARWLAAGAAAAIAGSLTWLVPLIVSCGSPRRYADLIAGQASFHRQYETAALRPEPAPPP